MSQLIEPATIIANGRAIQVADIRASANSYAPAAGKIDTTPSAPPLTPVSTLPPDIGLPDQTAPTTLKSLDKRLGPLRFGNLYVTRLELKEMGAKVHGRSIRSANANIQTPDQTFVDGLSFDMASIEARVRSTATTDSGTLASLLFEIACKRSIDAPPLFIAADPLLQTDSTDRLNKLGNAAQKMDIHRVESLENHPAWVNKGKSYLMGGAGVGLQAYGIYSGFMGAMEAIKVGQFGEAAFNGGSIASEISSLIFERGLAKTGEAMIKNGSVVFSRFSATSVGSVLGRGAGLFASVITLPFDVISAVKAFNSAAASQGKEAQDHYVSGSLSVAGATISLVLGVAALAGFGSVAGPIGIAAAAVLIAGAEIYRAARIVDDIDDYIDLTAHERLRSGWFAFTRQELDTDVMNRFKIAKARTDYSTQLEMSAKDLLNGAYAQYVEYIVDGSFNVELKPVQFWNYQWNENAGEQPFETNHEPLIVDCDDVIDARDGLPENLKGAVKGTPGENKGVFWRLGDGDDQVFGFTDKPNSFSYREGAKTLAGGHKDDEFYFETSEAEFYRRIKPARPSFLDGGEGSDTLTFLGFRPTPSMRNNSGDVDTLHCGYDVNLQTGKVALRSHDPTLDEITVAQLQSIENISTLRLGSNRITGSDKANRISANGNDHIIAGAGDDTIAIRGAVCRVDGGPGEDRYYISETSVQATIIEDGGQSSLIEFGWPMERIQSWKIVDTALVVSSLRGKDGELPGHELTIENVYQRLNGQRQLKNSQLRFKTEDRHELIPVLPVDLTDSVIQEVECIVAVVGDPAPAPHIVTGGDVIIAEPGSQHYFISCAARHVFFIAPAGTPETSKTIHLDYKHESICSIKINYEVVAIEGVSGYTFLSYSNFNLWIELPSRMLNITGVIRESEQTKSSTKNFPNIKAASIVCAHDIVLVMKDGKSYRLTPPVIDYREDAANPGMKSRPARECLTRRHGSYRFIQPQQIKPHLLAATPQKINFPPAPHTGIYVLQGQASAYDLYPVSNTTFSLSTPGAIAQTSDGSTWTIFCNDLKESITRSNIYLAADSLTIGSIIVQLPRSDHAGPIDSISVVTSARSIYKVDLIFEALQLYVLDAQSYPDVDDLLVDINTHRERDELAFKLIVKNIASRPLVEGDIFYHSTNNYWGVDSDPARRIKTDELVIEPLVKN